MGYKQYRRKSEPVPPGEKMAHMVTTYLPKSLFNILKSKSEKQRMPVSRLVAYAIDKECEKGDSAFDYDCSEPAMIYVENAYVEEGGRIYRYLLRAAQPLSVDQLMLARRDIGIQDKLTLLLGVRELVERASLVDVLKSTSIKFAYNENYRVIAVKTDQTEKKKEKIEKLKKQIAELEGSYVGSIGTEASDRPDTEE